MGGLFTALNAGKTSLEVNQKSIEIIGNNISNVNTEGYSRQSAVLTPYPSMSFGSFFIGQGVKVSDVTRDHDTFVTNQLQEKSIEYGLQSGQSNPLAELERIFNISDNNLATDIDNFFDSWKVLSANPSGLVERDIVIQRGEQLADSFHTITNDLNKVQQNINDSIISKVDDVNSKITEIADLNTRIFNIEIQGQTANSARDRRDMLAKDLASSLGVQTYTDSKGMMAVQLPGGLPLVQGTEPMTIEAVPNGQELSLVLHTGGVTRNIGLNNLGGELYGLVNIRDTVIPGLNDNLDQLAYNISTAVNSFHTTGAGLDDSTGLNFFTPNSAPPLATDPLWLDAARNISVALTNSNQVAAAQAPVPPATVAPGDNRNALIIADLGETSLINGSDTFDSYFGKMVSKVGIMSNQNKLSLGGAEDAMVQLQNLRDGMAGVSLDEEMISLIQFQRGFESSAKFLSTIDEMMASLMDLKR
ncbi:MAG: flagellar hook-associated protein FlgK [Proteobacteria bacterium]|jgi:flagellar hook-associated protein 1 FlgK|nr:flagellar hook-associated protein FlgK [Desulfocapsa sp.]MBU3943834.1 flagellar hook-associated protein FlgK [Pseudomonadota bacterium]MCG2743703.1 flagellar hook-associated protein FlgK [Desulfobacteraceae bacterium]MBU4083001.1 flagellar hook-associated protein FlgK [Pseudomonadota bacterium]MBU4108766.1 flagellar hook-associated protein FlgK [Pseudomonadota bacterium]